MKTNKSLSIIVLALMTFSGLKAQNEVDMDALYMFDDDSRSGKFYLVPEAGLWFGTYTNIELAPQLGYHITDRWSVGVGPHYIFYKNNSFYSPVNFSSNIWGIKTFSRFSIIRDASEILPFYLFDELFAHLEYERMSLENQYFNGPSFPEEGRFWVDYLFVGAGISQGIGRYSSYSFMLLWNVNQSLYSFYRNPTYRVSFSIYF